MRSHLFGCSKYINRSRKQNLLTGRLLNLLKEITSECVEHMMNGLNEWIVYLREFI